MWLRVFQYDLEKIKLSCEIDGTFQIAVGVIERETKNTTVSVSVQQGDVLYILVENQGRINYGSQINNNTKVKNVF